MQMKEENNATGFLFLFAFARGEVIALYMRILWNVFLNTPTSLV